MADISKEIQDFREAVYGEEVRGSMISLAEKVNAESEDSAEKVAEYGKAEVSRAQAEADRVNAEKARVTAENGRVSAEKTRVSEETARVNAEKARVTAENGRVSAESSRDQAETARASAEMSRASEETKRASAETARVNAEKSRVTAEEGRASAETARANAESARVTAEATRQKDTVQAIEDCDDAADRANAAAEAAEGIVAGTGLVTTQEKGAANGVATLDENKKIPQAQIDGNNIPIMFEQATQRANIQSGDTIAEALAKLSKLYADLKPHAFADPVNNLTGTDASLPLAAPQGKALDDKITQLNSALDDMIYNDVIDNAILIDIDDPLGDYNTKMWRCYTSLGTINMPEVVKVAFRKPVMRFDANNILIELYEIAPVYGRIWFNKYAKDQNKWIGWKSITPQ